MAQGLGIRCAVALALLAGGLTSIGLGAGVARADTGCPAPAAQYGDGLGTQASPWVIDDSTHLQRLRDDSATGWDDSYVFTSNIDMGTCVWTSTIGTASKAFSGSLDGDGHEIVNLDITISDSSGQAFAGLVGLLSTPGKITRLGFTNGSVSASGYSINFGSGMAYAGALAGRAAANTTISYSSSTGTSVSASGSGSGGGYGYGGGLVGQTDQATVSDSFSSNSVTSSGSGGFIGAGYAGGLIGVATSGSVTRNYATGTVSGSASGGLIGYVNNASVNANFHDTTTGMAAGAGSGPVSGIAGKTTTQLQQYSTYDDSGWTIRYGWASFDPAAGRVWGICSGSTRAYLLWQRTSSPCTAPGASSVTGVSPSVTTAAVSYAVDDSGGSSITRLEFALDDTQVVDDSTTTLTSPYTLTGLTPGGTYRVYVRAVNGLGPGPWSPASSPFTTTAYPGPPIITGVTPGSASALITYTADDSGGSPITRVEFALDDTQVVDDSTTYPSSSFLLTGLTTGTTYTLYARAVSSAGPGSWSAGTEFTATSPPAPPVPVPATASPPQDVIARPGNGAAEVAWQRPATSGDFPVTSYQATATPGGFSCLTEVTACTISGLVNGTTYRITVRALTGAGWSSPSSPSNAVTPQGEALPSVIISATRGQGAGSGRIFVDGASTGLVGKTVYFWVALPGSPAARARTTATIQADGSFDWSRKTDKRIRIYAEAGGIRSNRVTIAAR